MDNYRLFMNKFYDISWTNENKILIGFHTEFESIYLIKNNQIINDIMSYIQSDDFIEDIHEAYYYMLVLIGVDWKLEKRFIVNFYLRYKRIISMSIKKVRCKNYKRWMDIYIY